MALANLVRVVSATTGTGTLTLGAAVTGFITPSSAGMVDGIVYSYAIEANYVTVGDDSVPTSREVGTGTYTVSGTTLTRSVINSTNSNALLSLNGDEQVIITPNVLDFASRTGPTFQSLTSGTGATYTTPAGVRWIEVFMVGGGGGGSGASSTASTTVAGTAGNLSTFNAINAAGGSPGTGGAASAPPGGAGGTGGTGTATRRQPGHSGSWGTGTGTYGGQGMGGVSYFGGAPAATAGTVTSVGASAAANSGAGGNGAFNTTGSNVGGGGGGGEFVYLLILNPAATYTYTVGASAAGGVSTTNGGAGGSGFIFVIEHYNS